MICLDYMILIPTIKSLLFLQQTYMPHLTVDLTPDKSHSPSPGPNGQTVLVESQINAIAESAAKLASELPPFEPRNLNTKKQINREIMVTYVT